MTGNFVRESADPSDAPRWWRLSAVHAGFLALVTGWCLMISWRKWADLGADFGREVYIPWRLSSGALLYRDVDDFYGPLSQYVNAELFRLFGPGIMVLVAANLAIFAVILATLYFLVRSAWDSVTAAIASAAFVVVFGFSRAIGTGNFNYATPYSHESTHGILVLLLLVSASFRFLRQPTRINSLVSGGLCGLALVLKPEFVLATGAVTAVTGAIWLIRGGRLTWPWIGAWLTGLVAPTLVFVGYFLRHEPWSDAWTSAGRAWINVVATTRFVREPAQIYYLGLDAPWRHLGEHGMASALALGVVAVVVASGRLSDRMQSAGPRWFMASALAIAIGAFSFEFRLQWLNFGKCLLGLTVVWLGAQLMRWTRMRNEKTDMTGKLEMRLLLGFAAIAMLARMALNGRVYQFGFFQAALAAVVVVAALIGEVPNWQPLGAAGRATVRIAFGVLLISGIGLFAAQNLLLYRQIDFEVGDGRDRFLIYGPKIFPQGRIAANVVRELAKAGGDQRLLVLPEGLMLNYLARMPSPLPHFFYYSVVTADGREAQLVKTVDEHPPEWVIVCVHDLTEYGITHWGERSGAGKELVQWVAANYQPAGQVDGRPFNLESDGIVILRRRQP